MGCEISNQQKKNCKKRLNVASNQNKMKFKAVLLGNSSVGKSSIATRYINGKINENYGPTVGGVFFKKQCTLKSGHKLTLNLWDTAGEQKYKAMAPLYYRDASVCLIVFDVTDRQSFKSIDYWIQQLEDKTQKDNLTVFVVGNKCDSTNRVISTTEAMNKIKRNNGISYCETSAYTGSGINQLFENVFNAYIQKESE